MIYTIGETVLDIYFKENQPFMANPGGAMLNSAVSLGRLKTNVSFLSEFANDQIGEQIFNFLTENNIETKHVYRHSNGKTSLALAYLNQVGDANYTFYKIPPKERMQIDLPEFTENDFLLFGSYFSLDPQIRYSLVKILEKAKNAHTFIIYDPNFRKPHLPDLQLLLPNILENIAFADLVRASDEDFFNIFQIENGKDCYKLISDKCKYFIYTKASKGVELFSPQYTQIYKTEQIKPLSTVGAGDTFNAAVLYFLNYMQNENKRIENFTADDFDKLVKTGISMSTHVCMSTENYIDNEFAEKISSEFDD